MFTDNAPIMHREFRDHRPAACCATASSRGARSSRITVFAVAGFFLTYTRWGREIFAIGGARNEAIAAGVPRVRPLAIAFAISAFCASLAGALAAMRGGSALRRRITRTSSHRRCRGAARRHQPLWRARHGAQRRARRRHPVGGRHRARRARLVRVAGATRHRRAAPHRHHHRIPRRAAHPRQHRLRPRHPRQRRGPAAAGGG